MKIMKLFSIIVLIQSQQFLYEKIKNKIMMKIKYRDYLVFDFSKQNKKIIIYASYCDKKINFLISDLYDDLYYNSNLGNFDIKLEKKNTNDIIKEIEYNIEEILNDVYNHSIVLFYDGYDFINFSTFKIIIEELKKQNLLRRTKRKSFEICYVNICHQDNFLQKIINGKNYQNEELSRRMELSSIYYYIDYFDNKNYVCIRIVIDNICFFFSFCIDDLYYLVNAEVNIPNNYECQIFKKLIDLYNLSSKNFNLYYVTNCTTQINWTANKIAVINKGKYFSIRITQKIIIFKSNATEYFYYTDNTIKNNYNKSRINISCFTEFKKIFDTGYKKNIKTGIKLFYKLMKINHKIEFLLGRIINTQKSALNLILLHLMLHKKLLDENTLSFLIGEREDSEISLVHVIKDLSAMFKNSDKTELYLLKLILILEAEKYINDKDVSDDSLFKIIKDIGDIVVTKNNKKEGKIGSNNRKYNLVKIFSVIVEVHNNYKYKYENAIEKKICNTFSLLSVSQHVKIYNDVFSTNYHIKKNCVIKCLQLDTINIEKDNKNLIKKIKENMQSDDEKKLTRNRLIEIHSKHLCNSDLDNIGYKILNNYIYDNNDETEKNNLLNEGIDLIEKSFSNCESKLISMNIDKKTINEYKDKLKDKFLYNFIKITPGNIQTKCKKYFNHALIELFKHEFSEDKFEKQKWNDIILKLKEFLGEKIIFDVVNDNLQLFNDLSKILGNQKKNK
ncbi:uncharacterized protein VNE69_04001 [Vairimorpha necatrix]|uniref:Uncharacterized protein n=1 Tax=Vairimorpha necatrix TaxID=6039 RepID=A0AAX4JB80_9MICR